MAKREKKNITLGSGRPYIMEYSGEMPTPADICVPANLLGYVQGGASLEYTVETHDEKDDLGYVSKNVITGEELLLKLGLLTWNGDTLQNLVDRCTVTEEEGKRTIKIGGAGNAQGKEWVLCFHHEDKKDGDLWILIRGNNTAGLTLTLAADAGTKLEPEFKALPQDDDGTLAVLIEDISA